MKIELKIEEPEEINKDEGIKKAMEVQAPAVKEEDITQVNILLKDHIVGLKGIIRRLEELLLLMCDYPPSSSPPPSPPRT